MKIIKDLSFILIIFIAMSCTSPGETEVSVIPQPATIKQSSGFYTINRSAKIGYKGPEAENEASFLSGAMRTATGFDLPVTGKKADITLIIDTTREWHNEEYNLVVQRKGVMLSSGTPEGLFRGIQTILQLLPPQIADDTVATDVRWVMPCVSINDYPRFAWRGMHLDVSRHFFGVDFIKRYIDLIAMHKMNVFHWHLVDDQGWRIEIKKYPLLTEVGAWRVDREDLPWRSRELQKPGEKATYGGYYTQEQIKEIISYAAERHITVVPEIEMPAHVGSALAAYPEYSCTGGPFTVPPGSVWPNVDNYCPGKDETFAFLEDVLTEVIELFPSEYIHIGGDEADKTEWKKCPDCQARIHNENLKDEAELQSYFIKRIERFISSKGRKMIGWDEILEGGLAPGAAVMSWRGFEGGIAAARAQHYVVMSPVSHCYFDYYQGDPSTEPEAFGGYTTLKKVYSFEPIPDELTPEESKYIMGAQANLWTEMVPNGKHAEYMVVPRMTALSEVLWSAPENRNWEDFSRHLEKMTERFDIMDINYSKGTYKVEMAASYNTDNSGIEIKLTSEQPDPEIRYTTNKTDPSPSSPLYNKPLIIDTSATIRAAVFVDGKIMGKISEKSLLINKATGKKVTYNIACSNKYKADGDITLVNGISGTLSLNDGQWQGYEGTDMDVVIDMGKITSFNKISAGFLASSGSWIFLPQWVEYSISQDGETFTKLGKITVNIDPKKQTRERIEATWQGEETQAKYIRVIAKNLGICPPWHAGAGGKAWLFADEIIVK